MVPHHIESFAFMESDLFIKKKFSRAGIKRHLEVKNIFYGLFWIVVLAYSGFSTAQYSRQILQTGSVMGFRHYEGKQVWNDLHIGQKLLLIREPDNTYDSQAIRVEWQGHKLGFVPKADNIDLARLMDNGTRVEAKITALNRTRRPNNRVVFEVYLAPTDEQ